MERRQRKQYLGFPPLVMAIKCSQHRSYKMIQVLSHYGKSCSKRSDKENLLRSMVSLEAELTVAQRTFIGEWMLEKESGDFADAVPRPVTAPRDVECSVCMDVKPKQDFPGSPVNTACNHVISVCSDCTKSHIETQVVEQPYEQVACPECPQLLRIETIRMLVSEEYFERYSMKGFKEALQKMEGYVRCLGSHCNSGQIHGSGHDQPIMTCPECHFKTCYTHMLPWHTGQTCAEYDEANNERRKQDEASTKLIAETSKTCPNPLCGYSIEKNGGCDHMTCKLLGAGVTAHITNIHIGQRCKYEFCWICLACYTEIRKIGNTAHREYCLYHTRRLPPWIPLLGEHYP